MATARPVIRVPVHWLSPDGSQSSHPVNGEPCIKVGISFQSPVAEGKQLRLNAITWAYALLDTGAQWNLVEEKLVHERQSPALETLTNHGATGSATITNHAVALFLKGTPDDLIHNTGAGTIDLSARKVPWRMILGRKFLQTTRFSYNSTQGIKEIELIQDPNIV
jgi:hypothetical protein